MALTETWNDVQGYEGLYLISTFGRIVALPKVVNTNNKYGSIVVHRKSKSLKTYLRGRHGHWYEAVTLSKDGVSKRYSIHRLVAETFIPNPDNLPEVNHKDKNPLNNCVDNLEWCTKLYNIGYSKNKGIAQIKDGNVVNVYKSITAASRESGIGRTSINNALCGWSKRAGGYEWSYCE